MGEIAIQSILLRLMFNSLRPSLRINAKRRHFIWFWSWVLTMRANWKMGALNGRQSIFKRIFHLKFSSHIVHHTHSKSNSENHLIWCVASIVALNYVFGTLIVGLTNLAISRLINFRNKMDVERNECRSLRRHTNTHRAIYDIREIWFIWFSHMNTSGMWWQTSQLRNREL